MSHKLFARSHIVTLMTLLALTACGKNMHVGIGGAAKGTDNGKPGTIDASKQSNDAKNDGSKTDLKADLVSKDPVAKKAAQDALYSGQLHPYSKFDLSELVSKRPYLNAADEANAVRVIGEPSAMDKDSGLGFVKDSNLVFRAIVPVPKKEDIKSILNFELELKGLRLFDRNGSELKSTDLSEQVLCIADSKICSGSVPSADADKQNMNPEFWDASTFANDEFSKIVLDQVLNYGKNGAVFESSKPIVLDMKKLFGLEKLSPGELIDWIYANSTEYAEPGYRKFRFVMGNNLFLEAGTLHLQFESSLKVDEVPGKLKNGETDAQFNPLSANTSLESVPAADGANAAASPSPTPEATPSPTPEATPAPTPESTPAPTPAPTAAPTAAPTVTPPATEEKPVAGATVLNKTAESSVVVKSTAPVTVNTEEQPAAEQPVAEEPAAERPAAVDLEPIKTVGLGEIALPQISLNLPSTLPLIVIQQKAGEPELQMKLDSTRLTFALNKASILANGKQKLIATAALLKQNAASIEKVKVLGRTDKTGQPAYNLDLSKRRALAVATILYRSGVAKNKLKPTGLGEPKVSSCDPKQLCSQDRRVDIEIKLSDSLSAKEKNAVIQALNAGLQQIWKDSVVKSN
jgi:outer membrane protein OmpA-like peptidoglycan-associated protein